MISVTRFASNANGYSRSSKTSLCNSHNAFGISHFRCHEVSFCFVIFRMVIAGIARNLVLILVPWVNEMVVITCTVNALHLS